MIGMLLPMTGCVFLRFSRVLVQMKQPERFLRVDLEQVPFDAVLNRPIVLLSDLEWLLGEKGQLTTGGAIAFAFKKSGPQDRLPWTLLLWVDERSRVCRFQVPERLSLVMGNEFLMRSIEAIGKAEVSVGQRRVYMSVEGDVYWRQIEELMGLPMRKEPGRWCYRFGEADESFSVTIEGASVVERVLMEANHYGIDVAVVPKVLTASDF